MFIRMLMIFLHLLFPLICSSVIVNKAIQLARTLPSTISYGDASESLKRWAESCAAETSSTAVPNVIEQINSDGVGLRAADYLIGRWFSTKSKANSACKHGKVYLNGQKIYASRILAKGDMLEIDFTEKVVPVRSVETILLDEIGMAAELQRLVNYTSHILDERRYPPLHLLYEDNDLAVVYKPSGIHSMKWIGTMKKKLFALDDILPLVLAPPEIIRTDEGISSDSMKRPLPCHRLDARVSGCLIVAKTRRAMSDLSKQFEHRLVEKEYRAILAGNLTEVLHTDLDVTKKTSVEWIDSGSVVDDMDFTGTPLQAYSSTRGENLLKSRRIGRITDPIDGFDALTEIEILDISPCSVYGALTTVSLLPHTGRRHQLRRHCAILGCPIIGDDLYHDAGMLPMSIRQAAIAALSVGKIKLVKDSALFKDGDEDGDQSEEILSREVLDETDKHANSVRKEENYRLEIPDDSTFDNSKSLTPMTAETKMDDQSMFSSSSSYDDLNAEMFDKGNKGNNMIKSPEGVRKKVGIFLMCTAVKFYHPVNTISGNRATDLTQPVGTTLRTERKKDETDSKKENATVFFSDKEERDREGDGDGNGVNCNDTKPILFSQIYQVEAKVNSETQIQAQTNSLILNQKSILDRIKISVRCDESPRFIRLREKAIKGFEWQLLQQIPDKA